MDDGHLITSMGAKPNYAMYPYPRQGSSTTYFRKEDWNGLYVRVIHNKGGSTTTWTIIRPDGLTDEEFTNQLASFDNEIELWKHALESA